MATQTDIFDVRLRISDPPGFVAFESVTALPVTAAHQTGYLYAGDYYGYDSSYEIQDLLVSDSVIGALIDASGTDSATCSAIKRIISQLGRSLQIKKQTGGADSTEWQSLADTIAYYRDLLAICSETKKSNDGADTGRLFTTATPEIGGGNL